MALAKKRVDLAVALFEQGFEPDLVESAVNACKTFDTALAWLGRASRKRKQEDKNGKQSLNHEKAAAKREQQAAAQRRGNSVASGSSVSSNAAPIIAQLPTPSRSSTGLKISKKAETCAICYSQVPASQSVQLACSHGWYCVHCMKMHTDARLAVGDVCVPCPECRRPIQDYCLKEFLSQDVMAQLHSRSICQAVASSPNLYTCPTPNCDMCVEVDDSEEAWLKKCPKCKKGSCLRCGAQPYHKGMSCQEHALRNRSDAAKDAEVALRRWMRRTGTKQCPRCKMGVTKEDLNSQNTQRRECHKMLCRHCGTRFCYKCLALLTDTYSCGCSIDAHNFINPLTGRVVKHLRKPGKASAAKKNTGKSSASKFAARRGRGRPRKA